MSPTTLEMPCDLEECSEVAPPDRERWRPKGWVVVESDEGHRMFCSPDHGGRYLTSLAEADADERFIRSLADHLKP